MELGLLLEKEIARFKAINNYGKPLNEVSYRFYNEDEEVGDDEIIDPDMPDLDNPDMGSDQPDDQMGMPDEQPMDDMPPEDTDLDMGGDMMGDEGGFEEESIEIDITDLVDSTVGIRKDVNSINDGINRLQNIIMKVANIETKLSGMDNIISNLEALTQQVALMRPATEAERRKALANDSYPFNVTIDDYKDGNYTKNQTELEKKNHRLSVNNTIMGDYDENKVKDSFY